MDLPMEKKNAILQTPEQKKLQLVRESSRRRRQLPPSEYLDKLRVVMESDTPKVSDYITRKYRGKKKKEVNF